MSTLSAAGALLLRLAVLAAVLLAVGLARAQPAPWAAVASARLPARAHFVLGWDAAMTGDRVRAAALFQAALHADPACALCRWAAAWSMLAEAGAEESRLAASAALLWAAPPRAGFSGVARALTRAHGMRLAAGATTYAVVMNEVLRQFPRPEVALLAAEAALAADPTDAGGAALAMLNRAIDDPHAEAPTRGGAIRLRTQLLRGGTGGPWVRHDGTDVRS